MYVVTHHFMKLFKLNSQNEEAIKVERHPLNNLHSIQFTSLLCDCCACVYTIGSSGGFRGGALGAEAPPFQSPLAFKCTDVAIMLR